MGRVTLLGCGSAGGVAAPAVYHGPGAVVGWDTAYGFWGMRAYDASKIGKPCIDICSDQYDGPTGLQTLNFGSDGYVNLSSLPAWSTIYIAKFYDQIGTQHLSYILGLANRPTLALNKIGGQPAIFFSGNDILSAAGVATALAQPISVAAVAIRGSGGMFVCDGTFSFMSIFFGAGITIRQSFDGSTINDYDGVGVGVTASYISVAASTPLPNGGSSSMSINGNIVSSSSNVGSGGIKSTNKFTIGGVDSGGALLSGYVYEVLVKAGAKNNTEQAAMTTNHHQIGTGWT